MMSRPPDDVAEAPRSKDTPWSEPSHDMTYLLYVVALPTCSASVQPGSAVAVDTAMPPYEQIINTGFVGANPSVVAAIGVSSAVLRDCCETEPPDRMIPTQTMSCAPPLPMVSVPPDVTVADHTPAAPSETPSVSYRADAYTTAGAVNTAVPVSVGTPAVAGPPSTRVLVTKMTNCPVVTVVVAAGAPG